MKEILSSTKMLRARSQARRRMLFTALYLTLALIVRFIYLQEFSESPLFSAPLGPDVEEYASWADEILSGNFLWERVRIHSPLYPYFLAAMLWIFNGKNALFCVRAIQIVLGFLAVFPICGALKLALHGDRAFPRKETNGRNSDFSRVVFIFLAIWAWYPPLIYYLGELTSEVLLVPLLSLSLYCLYLWDFKTPEDENHLAESESDPLESEDAENLKRENPRNSLDVTRHDNGERCPTPLFGGGLFVGFAVLAHPMALFFGLFEFIYYLIRMFAGGTPSPREIRGRALAPFIFALGLIVPVAPVVYYNVAVLGSLAPLQANGGFNFFLGNGPEADGTCRLRPGPEWDVVHAEAAKEAKRNGVGKDAVFIERTLKHIKAHPFEWMRLLFKKSLYVWNWRELTAGADSWPLRYFTTFQALFKWAFGFCAILALSGIFLNSRDPRFFREYRHFLLLLTAFWFAQTLLVTSGRYRVGMLPALLVLSAAGAATLTTRFSLGGKNALKGVLAVLSATVLVCVPQPPHNPDRELAEARTIIGEALIRRGFYADAEQFLIASAKVVPNWSRNYNLLGLSLEKRRKYALAEKAYRKAIGVAPDDPVAYSNLATLYSARGRRGKADLYFKMAFSLGSPSTKLRYNYALHCEKNGRMADAVREYETCLKANPAHIMALNNLGVIAFKQGNYKHSAALFKRSLRFDPENSGRMVNLAAASLLSGDRPAAQKWLQKALALDPDSRNALELLKRMKTEKP